MINLRYHIVSITAVFLALGIGLIFGSAFIDRATVGQLENNLTALENDLADLEATRDRLSERVGDLEAVEQSLLEQGVGQLVAAELDGVPVLVIAIRGVDEGAVQSARRAITAAGAQFGGVLWITDRLLLDDDSEIRDMATLLNIDSRDDGRLRRALVRRLGVLLAAAAEPVVPPDPPPAEDEAPPPPEPVPVPPLLQALLSAGFVELEPPDQPPAGFAVLPAGGARYLFVSGRGADLPDDDISVPLIRTITASATAGAPGPVLVAAQTGPAADEAVPEGEDSAALRVVFVGPLREEEGLRDRLSTVDHLETFAGLVAAVLALDHGAAGQYGHYGVGGGAQSLLPPALPPAPGGGG